MVLMLKMQILTVIFIFFSITVGNAQENIPRFEDFPVENIYKGPVAQPILNTPANRAFRTRLRRAAQKKPNFAGHYIATVFGCGACCVDGAILDAITGKVIWFPYMIGCADPNYDEPVTFRLNSSLIVFKGNPHEDDPNGEYYYNFSGQKFIKVGEVPLPGVYPHIMSDDP